MLTFAQLAQRVALNCQQTNATYIATQIMSFLEEEYHNAWDSEPWFQTLEIATLTLPASASTFRLPKKYSYITRAVNDSTEEPVMIYGPNEFAEQNFPIPTITALNSTATVHLTEVFGDGVNVQLPSAQLVKVVSSNAGDTKNVVLIGTNANGELISETVALNGTTQVPSVNSYTTVEQLNKTDNLLGFVSLLENNGTTLMATLGPYEKSPRYRLYQANVTPATDMTFSSVCKVRYRPIVNTWQTPFIDMDKYLIAKGTARVWMEHRNPTMVALWIAEADDAMQELKQKELDQDGTITLMVPVARC